jgi:hypothetical protein
MRASVDLVSDDPLCRATGEGLMAVKFVGAGLPFTAKGVNDAAQLLGVDTHTILAITEVETAGCGFLADRRP